MDAEAIAALSRDQAVPAETARKRRAARQNFVLRCLRASLSEK
jgi:hypothetical protein